MDDVHLNERFDDVFAILHVAHLISPPSFFPVFPIFSSTAGLKRYVGSTWP